MNNRGDDSLPEVLDPINSARASRQAVQVTDPSFFDAVSAAMFKHDPIGINFENNTDEYDAEAGTVIPRLSTCRCPDEVASVLHQEFQSWFGAEIAGDIAAYAGLAAEIWLLIARRGA